MYISQQKKKRISEQILSLLHEVFPRALFTAEISKELARDEEFTKSLLLELKEKNLISPINKNPKGKEYLKRTRWRISNKAQETLQNNQLSINTFNK